MPAAAVTRWGVIAALAGCGPVVLAPEDGTSTTIDHASGDPPDPMTTVGDALTSESATSAGTSTVGPVDPTTGSADESTSDVDSAGFIEDPDGGPIDFECSTWEQDCPRGEKCMPWDVGTGSWNGTRCSPISDDPKEPGEACTVVESAVSGIDDCVLGAMCWAVDPETLMGECVWLCQGTEANPTCPDPCATCTIYSNAVPTPCLPACDPIAQDCDEGQACYPSGYGFACAPDASGEEYGALGDVCEFLNVCDPGNLCVNGEDVPGCEGASCCTAFCDVDAADDCDALLPGTSCVPWYEDVEPDACNTGTVGACMLPQ